MSTPSTTVSLAQARRIAVRAQALDGSVRTVPSGETAWPRRAREWLRADASFRRYVLQELERNGPMLSRRFDDRAIAPWPSSGWTGNRNVGQMLESLMARGDVAVVGRDGKQRLWDLAARWYGDVEQLPHAEADAYFVLPVLRNDRLGGRIDPEVDRNHDVLRAQAVHWPDKPLAIERPVGALARLLGVQDVQWP